MKRWLLFSLAALGSVGLAWGARLPSEPQTRERLLNNLKAFHHLSPEVQAALRQLDQTLYDEDAITRQRLIAVMQRYAAWISRLNGDERQKINAAPAGSERLRLVREAMDRQWLAALPKPYRDELAAHPENRTALLEKWKAEDRERKSARNDALREAEFGPPIDRAFRDEVAKWVRETLEPKLNKRERDRLAEANRQQGIGWFLQVSLLSNKHGLKPPGPPEFWRRFDRNRPRAPPAD